MGRGHPSPPTARAVLVLAGGDIVAASLAAQLPAYDMVIAADSGAHQARQLGIDVDLAVGDFDSVDPDHLALLERTAEVERHPAAKDKTDIELALDAALQRAATSVVVVGGAGGRLDHALANLLVLAAPAYADLRISALIGPAQVCVVRGERRLHGRPGSVVSLLALGGPAQAVTTSGLRYRLDEDELQPGSTRGISNVMERDVATVRVGSGVIVAIQPGDEPLLTPATNEEHAL